MKHIITSFVLMLFVHVASYGQLKVYSNGHVGLNRTTGHDYHILNIGNKGLNQILYNVALYANNQDGWFYLNGYNIAIEGNSTNSEFNAGRSFGVRGIAGNGTNGWNYGVLGGLSGSLKGAGIFGTVHSHTGVEMSRQYAGYFDGPTHIDGELVVTGGITGLLISPYTPQPQKTQQFTSAENDTKAICQRLSDIDMYTYNKLLPNTEKRTATEPGDTVVVASPLSAIAKQDYAKQHYALSVEKLEEQFPDLVYELEDGRKGINYTEMIPLLVQCVNELNERLRIAEGKASASRQSVHETSSIEMHSASIASLKQNTPNPFTERTTIRFALPSDSKNAYVYIFDMSGKMLKQIPIDCSMESVTVNGYELTPGMYIYSLFVNGKEMDTKKMILSK